MAWRKALLRDLVSDVFVGLPLSRKASDQEGSEHVVLSVGDLEADGTIAPVASLPKRRLKLAAGDDRYRLRSDDIVLSARGTQLKVGWIDQLYEGVLATSTLIVIRPSRNVESGVLFGWLVSGHGQSQLSARTRQSTASLVLNVKDVETIELSIPPSDIQSSMYKLLRLGEEHHRAALEVGLERRALARSTAEQILMANNSRSTDKR